MSYLLGVKIIDLVSFRVLKLKFRALALPGTVAESGNKKSQSEKCQKYKSQSEKCQQKKSQSCLGAYDKVSLSFEPISFMPSAISAFDI